MEEVIILRLTSSRHLPDKTIHKWMNLKMKYRSKILKSFTFTICLIAVTLLATAKIAMSQDAVTQTKVELSQELHETWAVKENVIKLVEQIAEAMPAERRAEARERLLAVINPEKVEKISVATAAETFSEGELEAMVEYYKSPMGQAAEAKRPVYEEKLSTQIQKLVDQGIADLAVSNP